MKPDSTAPKPLTAEQRALVEENHNLIYGYLHSHGLRIDEWYDLFALALCKAAANYDEKKGLFSVLVYACFGNVVRGQIRDMKAHKNICTMFPLVVSIPTDGDRTGYEIETPLPVDEPGYEQTEINDLAEHIAKRLNQPEKDILRLRTMGFERREIAEMHGVTTQRIAKRLERIQQKALIELGRGKKERSKKPYHMSGKRFSPEEATQIWEKYCENPARMRNICEEHDIVVSTAYIWLRKMGYDVDTVKRSHVCVVCGKAFTGHAAAKTCSPECKAERNRQYTYNRYHHLPTDPPSRSQLDNKTAAQIAAEARAHGGMSYGKYVALVEGN